MHTSALYVYMYIHTYIHTDIIVYIVYIHTKYVYYIHRYKKGYGGDLRLSHVKNRNLP